MVAPNTKNAPIATNPRGRFGTSESIFFSRWTAEGGRHSLKRAARDNQHLSKKLIRTIGVAESSRDTLASLLVCHIDNKPGFILFADRFSPEGGGHAEDLQDHNCAIARAAP